MDIIMIFVFVTMAVALYASFQTAASPKNNVILNNTLPRANQKDPRVQKIVSQFKRVNLLAFLAALALAPIILLVQMPSFMILYLSIWFVATLLGHNWLLTSCSRKLSALKQQEQWFVGNPHTITIDLEVTMAKGKMAVSKLWFLPSLLAALLLLSAGLTESQTFYPGIAASLGVVTHFYLYTLTVRERARAYSDDTEINMAITRASIRMWSVCWIGLAALHVISMGIFFYALGAYNSTVILIVVGSSLIINLSAIFLTYNKIKNCQNRLLAQSQAPIYVDEDYYWRGGFYNNPNDSRIMVEKRIGAGQTLNLGTKQGKIAYYSLIIGLPALLLALFLMFLNMDTANFELTIRDNMAEIHAPMYGYEFPLSDIKSVTTIDTLPRGTKTNGAGTSQYNLGNYSLQGYGKCKMYVYKDHSPYIVIELPNLYIFLNAKDSEQTWHYYEMLVESSK